MLLNGSSIGSRLSFSIAFLIFGIHLSACGSSNSPSPTPPVDRETELASKTIENSYPKELKAISTVGTAYSIQVAQKKMAPRGSAVYTSSGDLEKKGITAVIHAATGSASSQYGAEFEPTLESIELSVWNSMVLARRYQHKGIAIPFLGGNIFLGRIGTTSEKLAETIIRAGLTYRKGLTVRFITYGPQTGPDNKSTQIFKNALTALLQEPAFKGAENSVSVIQGELTDYSVHQCSAIVNAANMEVVFGGGLSGAIASATGQSAAIDQEAENVVTLFNQHLKEKLNSGKN